MKHAGNREFYSYWDRKRAGASAPDRSVIEPDHVRHLLGDIFVVAYDPIAGYPLRVAGTRMCALLGRDLKGQRFTDLFCAADRREVRDILEYVAEESLPTVVGLVTEAPDVTPFHLELLLLPFSARSHTPLSLTGLLAPLTRVDNLDVYGGLGELGIISRRHLQPEPDRPRELRKWSIIRGLTVYEGLR